MRVFFGLFDGQGYPATPGASSSRAAYGLDVGTLSFEDLGIYLPVSSSPDIDVEPHQAEITQRIKLKKLKEIPDLRPYLVGVSISGFEGGGRRFTADLMKDHKYAYGSFHTENSSYNLPRGFTVMSMDEEGAFTLSNGEVHNFGKITVGYTDHHLADIIPIQ